MQTEIFFLSLPVTPKVIPRTTYEITTARAFKSLSYLTTSTLLFPFPISAFIWAEEVHFLDNRELCEKEGNAQWVFLGHFSNSSIFMNTADKRLCFTDAKNYRLVARKILENK
jgi:hypothetical protein